MTLDECRTIADVKRFEDETFKVKPAWEWDRWTLAMFRQELFRKIQSLPHEKQKEKQT